MEEEVARVRRATEETVEQALRRTEAAEEALLKKNRTVEFGEEKIKEVQTVLTAPAKAGDTKIEVENNEDFPIGCQISIGNMHVNDVRTVTGHGSLILSSPLRHSYDAGTGVFLYQSTYDRYTEEYHPDDENWGDEEDVDDTGLIINVGTTPNHSDFEDSDSSVNSSGKV